MKMDKDDIEKQIKVFEFLKTFDDDVKRIVEKLIQRYKVKPTERADIVISTAVTICGRIIAKTIPQEIWEQALVVLAEGLMDINNKNNNQTKH